MIPIYTSRHIRLWVQHVGGEPALCLGRNRSAFVIPLSVAHEYTDDRYLIKRSLAAAKTLKLEPVTRGELKSIADAILHGLDALVKCPPESEAAALRREQQDSGVSIEGEVSIDGKRHEFVM